MAADLADLARRVIARPEVFRTVLGPAYPGHHNHFHLDCAPYRVVEVFEHVEQRHTQPARVADEVAAHFVGDAGEGDVSLYDSPAEQVG